MLKLTHTDERGQAAMVDVGSKPSTEARACSLEMSEGLNFCSEPPWRLRECFWDPWRFALLPTTRFKKATRCLSPSSLAFRLQNKLHTSSHFVTRCLSLGWVWSWN